MKNEEQGTRNAEFPFLIPCSQFFILNSSWPEQSSTRGGLLAAFHPLDVAEEAVELPLYMRLFSSERTRRSSSLFLIGLDRKSSAPTSTARSMSLAWSRAVTMRTAVSRVAASARRRLHTSKPLIRGIIMSRRIRSGCQAATCCKVCSPSEAVRSS